MVAEVLALELFELGVLRRRQAERGLGNLGGEDGVFALLPHAALLPFVGEFVADGDGTHPFLNPIVRIALGFVEGTGAFGGEFGVFNFLNAFVADAGEPAFERFGLGAGDGLNQAEDAFGVPALQQLPSARRVKLKAKGGGNLPPPLENIGQGRIAAAHILEIARRIDRIREDGHNVRNHKPPFIVVNRAADFLALEQGDASFWILV